MDQTDIKILDCLQDDATLDAAGVAGLTGLAEADCASRIARLEAEGVIAGRVTLLNPKKAGAGVTVFVAITTPEHTEDWLENFHRAVEAFPEVVEFYRMSGQVDYLLRVVVADIEGYDAFYKKLIKSANLKDVSSTFAMEQIKYTTRLPVSEA